MNSSITNSVCISILSIIIVGCATSSYKVLNQTKTAMEFEVSPNRVLLECEEVQTDDGPTVYGFMIHVLDEQKTSFTLTQTNALDKASCYLRIKKISRILKNGSQIYLAGIGDFRELRKTGLRKYTFPIGLFEDNGRSLQFIAVKNERNQCYGAFTAEKLPCPPEPFPIQK